MKTLGLIIVCSLGILITLVLLLPIGISMQIHAFPDKSATIFGKAKVGDITVQNNGWFTQTVDIPEITGCIGDQEVPLDSWLAAGSSVVKGAGSVSNIKLKPGEEGTIYLVASDATINEKLFLYHRVEHFSCLIPGKKIE